MNPIAHPKMNDHSMQRRYLQSSDSWFGIMSTCFVSETGCLLFHYSFCPRLLHLFTPPSIFYSLIYFLSIAYFFLLFYPPETIFYFFFIFLHFFRFILLIIILRWWKLNLKFFITSKALILISFSDTNM